MVLALSSIVAVLVLVRAVVQASSRRIIRRTHAGEEADCHTLPRSDTKRREPVAELLIQGAQGDQDLRVVSGRAAVGVLVDSLCASIVT